MGGEDATPTDTFVKMAERAEALELDSLWLSAHVVLPPQVKSGYVLIPEKDAPGALRSERYWDALHRASGSSPPTPAASRSAPAWSCSRCTTPSRSRSRSRKWTSSPTADSSSGSASAGSRKSSRSSGRTSETAAHAPDDALELMKKLWTDEPVTYKGRFYSCEDASFAPKPVQGARIRRSGSPARAAPPAAAPRSTGRRSTRCGCCRRRSLETAPGLDIQCEKFGRAPGSVKLCVKLPVTFQDGPGEFPTQGTPQQIVDGFKRYIEIGAEHFTLDFVPEKVDKRARHDGALRPGGAPEARLIGRG